MHFLIYAAFFGKFISDEYECQSELHSVAGRTMNYTLAHTQKQAEFDYDPLKGKNEIYLYSWEWLGAWLGWPTGRFKPCANIHVVQSNGQNIGALLMGGIRRGILGFSAKL